MIWRYLIKSYLKIFFISLLSFIAFLLIIRLEEIARFAALGAQVNDLMLFLAIQIPYILPFALAISTLLASTLLFHSLSTSHELTALRSSGLSLVKIASPVIFTSILLGILSFGLASEVATSCHFKTKEMLYSFTAKNPLLLLSKQQLPFLKGAIVQTTKPKKGKEIGDLVIAYANEEKDEIVLLLGKNLALKNQNLSMSHLTAMSFSKKGCILNNEEDLSTKTIDLTTLFSKSYHFANDHLTLSSLRLRIQELKELEKCSNDKTKWKNKIEKCKSEIARRWSLGFSPITFTLMGIFFGMQIGRKQKTRFVYIAILASFTLTTYFMAKSFADYFWISLFFYLSPHVFINILTFFSFLRIKKGIV